MVCLDGCGNENVSLKPFEKVSYTSTLCTNSIILRWQGYAVAEASKINDDFQLQQRINLILFSSVLLPKRIKGFF